jgi:hypothetical protein
MARPAVSRPSLIPESGTVFDGLDCTSKHECGFDSSFREHTPEHIRRKELWHVRSSLRHLPLAYPPSRRREPRVPDCNAAAHAYILDGRGISTRWTAVSYHRPICYRDASTGRASPENRFGPIERLPIEGAVSRTQRLRLRVLNGDSQRDAVDSDLDINSFIPACSVQLTRIRER